MVIRATRKKAEWKFTPVSSAAVRFVSPTCCCRVCPPLRDLTFIRSTKVSVIFNLYDLCMPSQNKLIQLLQYQKMAVLEEPHELRGQTATKILHLSLGLSSFYHCCLTKTIENPYQCSLVSFLSKTKILGFLIMLQHWNTNILLRNIRRVFIVPLVFKYPNYSLTSISYFYWIISCSTRNFSLESPCTAKVLICLSSKPTHVISV